MFPTKTLAMLIAAFILLGSAEECKAAGKGGGRKRYTHPGLFCHWEGTKFRIKISPSGSGYPQETTLSVEYQLRTEPDNFKITERMPAQTDRAGSWRTRDELWEGPEKGGRAYLDVEVFGPRKRLDHVWDKCEL